ncbi:MAG: helix-hairpin-helix domain-containing protein [Vicinamibacterales bacterium]
MRRAVLIIFCVVFISRLGSAPVPANTSYQESSDPGAPVFANVCGKCHPKERAVVTRRTRSQWEEVITTMITTRNAQISDEDFDTVLGYLTREYGRVNINRAPAPDIVEVLHVPEKVGETIVQYRKEHGPFEDFDGLVKVPGIDRDKLESRRDAILFQ